ncbi:alanine--tRNA ligase [Huintestinicola butyrica]|uniref:alanine--tRNA ligase n=1 Tax=Huintestinicola butyrica TaxID=2981728 RepID=UPI003F80C4ED
MEWTGLNQLREKYLSFFESKGHTRLPSANLIPQGDNSLLLINSGMAPLKKFFLGTETPPNVRVTTCQKCIRTPDIERVGKTARHGTYFEMLGNFSFGDYFKKEAIAWAWEFLTGVLEIPADRLWITIFESDDEAESIWMNDIGIPKERIIRLGKADNFWEHGSGPCGPCSEIHFDRGEEYGPFESFEQASDCDRVIEIWNLVFSQFDSDGNGHYAEMAHKNIDTGMGLERLACAMQGVDNLFEVDTVQNIMKHISRIAGVNYKENEKSDVSLRVITDHIRSTTFMVGDGVTASNTGRGYVLRRLLRRAARHGRLLGIKEPFLYKVADTVIDENKCAYPELEEKREYIKKLILNEEESFAKTIDAGMDVLTKMLDGIEKGGVLSGEDTFKLSDTYGFPIDLTKEIAEEKGISVDEEGFRACVDESRKRSREDRLAKGGSSWDEDAMSNLDLPKTKFTGYDYSQLEINAKVLAVFKDGAEVSELNEGDDAVVILDETPFYAESGGQVGDTGVITIGESRFAVTDTKKTAKGQYLHFGTVEMGGIGKGDNVTASVNVEKRYAIMRNHTAAHLLQAALRKVLGDHVHQAGSYVDAERCRFDFSHFEAVTPEQLSEIEAIVNKDIFDAIPVTMTEMPIEEAKKLGAMALFGEKYGNIVRVVEAKGVSVEFCGGTHIDNTARLGLFRIVSENSVAAGVRRIEAVTGAGVLNMLNKYHTMLVESAAALKVAKPEDVAAKCAAVAAEVKSLEKEKAELNAKIAASQTGDVMADAVSVGAVRAATVQLTDVSADALRKMGDEAKDKNPDAVVVFASVNGSSASLLCVCGKEAVAAGANAGKIVKEVAAVTGGKGGGRPDSAMAGAGDASLIGKALEAVPSIVGSFVK